jgi:HEAT repeat protein
MNTQDMNIEKIFSTRRTEILDGLRQIKADKNAPPQGQVLKRATELLQFPDADIREEAIVALGLHWQCQEIFPILLDMLDGNESDQVVLEIAARAIATYTQLHVAKKTLALKTLAKIVLNANYDPELRGIAYLSAKRLANQITDTRWAHLKEDIEELEVDWNWLHTLTQHRELRIPHKPSYHSTSTSTNFPTS